MVMRVATTPKQMGTRRMGSNNRIRRGAAMLAYQWQTFIIPEKRALAQIREKLVGARTKDQRARLSVDIREIENVLEDFIGILSGKYPDNLRDEVPTRTERDIIRMALDRAQRVLWIQAAWMDKQFQGERALTCRGVADSLDVARKILEASNGST